MSVVMATPLRRQRGVALLIALMILVIVSLMGITAMKTSIFSAKIATGTQVDAMTFAGAESAIDATIGNLNNNADKLQALMGGATMAQCITMADQIQDGECGTNDHLDSRDLVVSESHARRTGYQPINGGSVSSAAGTPVVVDYKIAILGDGNVSSFKRQDYHLQEVLKKGIKPSSDIE